MLGEKLEKIIEIADNADYSTEVEVWTNTFKARGTLIKDPNKTVPGIVSLTKARLIPTFNECNGPCDLVIHDWLNIFEEHIIAFTVIRL